MSFTWPSALFLLLCVPAVVATHLWQLRRRHKSAIRVASVSLVRAAVPKRSRWRRHLPVALLAGGLGALAVAAARPTVAVEVPLNHTTMLLALDTSSSMCNTDVDPNRLTVAQRAAISFIENKGDGTQVGLVAFNSVARLVVPPTTDGEELIAAINNLTVSRGTAIGMATTTAIDAIADINSEVDSTTVDLSDETVSPADGRYIPDIVVLLTDGANSQGTDPVTAAQLAVERRIRVYTIGFGTTEPAESVCTPEQLGVAVFGDGGSGGGPTGGPSRSVFNIDEPTLAQVAEMTGGEYYRAEDADQLAKVFDQLPSRIDLQEREVEISAWFAVGGAVLAAAALTLSLRWNRYP